MADMVISPMTSWMICNIYDREVILEAGLLLTDSWEKIQVHFFGVSHPSQSNTPTKKVLVGENTIIQTVCTCYQTWLECYHSMLWTTPSYAGFLVQVTVDVVYDPSLFSYDVKLEYIIIHFKSQFPS